MAQWGFYFNQDRCLGCKTCVLACKTWNDSRRGDALNVSTEAVIANNSQYFQKEEGGFDKPFAYVDKTGANNYAEDRKYYMKENWRKVETHDKGGVALDPNTNTFETTFDRRYLSMSCNHCSDCVCIKVCPMDVYYKDPDKGITLIRQGQCISCGRCKQACPYDAPQFYAPDFASYEQTDPNRPKVTKCTLCKDRIDIGLKPACVAACWNRALDAGPIDELREKYKGEYVEGLAEFANDGTKPMIIFKAKKNDISQK